MANRSVTSAPPPPAPASDVPSVESDGEAAVIQWDDVWLRDHWQAVINALSAAREMPVAGVIGPAKVASLRAGVLSLEYNADYDGLRHRGLKMVDEINRAMTVLAGVEITCKLNPTDGVDAQSPAQRAFGGLSTAETREIAKDPAVKILLDSFGGTLLDARRDPGAGLLPIDITASPDDDEA